PVTCIAGRRTSPSRRRGRATWHSRSGWISRISGTSRWSTTSGTRARGRARSEPDRRSAPVARRLVAPPGRAYLPAMTQQLEIFGDRLRLEDVEKVARGEVAEVKLAAEARARVEAARAFVDRIVEEGRVVYGITTGFGALAHVVIPPDRLRELQANLIRSHASGVGAPLPVEEVRAITLLRANVLA